LLHADHE
jgi:hypothetical protein